MFESIGLSDAEIVMDYCDEADGYYLLGRHYDSIYNINGVNNMDHLAKSVDYYVRAIKTAAVGGENYHHHHLDAYKHLCRVNIADDEKISKIKITWFAQYVEVLEKIDSGDCGRTSELNRVCGILGDIYSFEKHGKLDYKLAIFYYAKYTPQNALYANEIAYCWEKLDDVENQFLWYLKSAKLGHVPAMYNLYVSYKELDDPDKSFYWADQYLKSTNLRKLHMNEAKIFADIYLTGKINRIDVCEKNPKYAALICSRNGKIVKDLIDDHWWINETILSDEIFVLLMRAALDMCESSDNHIVYLIHKNQMNYLTSTIFRLMSELTSVEIVLLTNFTDKSSGARLKKILDQFIEIAKFLLSDFLDLAGCPREVSMMIGNYLPWFKQAESSHRQQSKKRRIE